MHALCSTKPRLTEELDGGVGVLDKHLCSEAQLVANQGEVLGVDALPAVGGASLQSLHAPQAALPTRRNRSDAILADVDNIVLKTDGKRKIYIYPRDELTPLEK